MSGQRKGARAAAQKVPSANYAPVGIIGGGALGLAAGLRLAEAGQRPLIIEREPALGGLAAGFRPGADSRAMLEKFYHHIFRTDRTIIRMIDEFGLTSRLLWGQPVTASLRGGTVYPLSATGLLHFDAIPLVDRVRFGATMLAGMKLVPSERIFAGLRASAFARRWAGDRAYEALLEQILVSKFGDQADEVAMSWLWSRFHERSLSLGYLRGGFQLLYDAIGARIRALGGEIVLGAGARAIRAQDGGVTVATDAGDYRFDQLLVTAPQRVFELIAEGLPAEYRTRYPGPSTNSAQVLILALDRPLSDAYWISISDPDWPFLVAVEHTNFLPAADYGGRHLLYLGNYVPPTAPLLRMSEQEVLDAFLPALTRINPAFRPSWMTDHWLFRAPFAQPIVTTSYLASLPPVETPLPGVFLATMMHVYPQDRGQNYSLALGERMAAKLLRTRAAR